MAVPDDWEYDSAQDPQRPKWKTEDFFGENFCATN